jgi:hypothetical protein
MLEFQLFRLKVFPSKQLHLFKERDTPSEILKEAISKLPSKEMRPGIIWHIGNLSAIGDSGLYFRIGKTSRKKMEFFKDGYFLDQEIEGAIYTHVVLDFILEVAAIAKKTQLSLKTAGIARYLIKLLNGSDDIKYEIAEINDPKTFITLLKTSLFIKEFWITFSKPNIFDVNKDFEKPMQKLLEESGGEKGKTILKGDELNPESLEDLARSAAAAGNDAAALLQIGEGEKKVRKSLKGNLVTFVCEDITEYEQKTEVLSTINKIYHRIRGTFN